MISNILGLKLEGITLGMGHGLGHCCGALRLSNQGWERMPGNNSHQALDRTAKWAKATSL